MIVRTCLRQRNAISNVQKPICSVCTFAPRQLAAAQDALTLFPPPQALPLRSPAAQCQSRRIHAVPSVGKYDTEFKEEGVPGLLTPESYNIAWTDYQKLMVSKLNTSLAADTRANWDMKTLLLNSARDPNQAHIFNYASMAHNNHFFFSSLSKDTTHIPEDLERHLVTSFGSLDTFRTAYLKAAGATFGPAFVWLVQQHNPRPAGGIGQGGSGNRDQLHFRILTTYLAGSPYPGAHFRSQTMDMNSQSMRGLAAADNLRQTTVQNGVGGFGAYAQSGSEGVDKQVMDRYGGADIVPVLCVNTWEHVWQWDWGVGGKDAFLRKWFDRIDWEIVWGRCDQSGSRYLRSGYRY